jgi:hypothetical protein
MSFYRAGTEKSTGGSWWVFFSLLPTPTSHTASFDLFLCHLRSHVKRFPPSLSSLRFIFSSALPAFYHFRPSPSTSRTPSLPFTPTQAQRGTVRPRLPPFFYSTPRRTLHALPVKRSENQKSLCYITLLASRPRSLLGRGPGRGRRHCEIWIRRGSRVSSPRSRRRSYGGCRRRGPGGSPRRRRGARRRRGC